MKKIRKLVLFFILVVLGFSISYASITTFATLLSVSGVDIIYANPGENCMNEVTESTKQMTKSIRQLEWEITQLERKCEKLNNVICILRYAFPSDL